MLLAWSNTNLREAARLFARYRATDLLTLAAKAKLKTNMSENNDNIATHQRNIRALNGLQKVTRHLVVMAIQKLGLKELMDIDY